MNEIIEYLIGGDMNWRMRFVWGAGIALVAPFIALAWFFCIALIVRIDYLVEKILLVATP